VPRCCYKRNTVCCHSQVVIQRCSSGQTFTHSLRAIVLVPVAYHILCVQLAGAEYEAMVRSDDQLEEAELTTQFKNFLRSNK
jgi:hypothetical protein